MLAWYAPQALGRSANACCRPAPALAGRSERAHADWPQTRRAAMPRIKHIALTTKEPAKVAAFYKDAFGMEEIRRAPNGAVFLTDGYINLAILNWKTEKSADVGAHGPNYSGIHHFGFEVEDLDEAAAKLERARGERLEEKAGLDMEMAGGGPPQFRDEMGWPRWGGDRHLTYRLGDDPASTGRIRKGGSGHGRQFHDLRRD